MSHTFRVWAPAATRVQVEVDGRGAAMEPVGERGWYEATVAAAGPGSDYAFVIDGGPPLPDPRSACQPAGVDGPSRLVDHSRFPWTDGGWAGIDIAAAVVYELHVGTFTPEGTFDAAIDKLDHLVSLGVNAVELMPVAEFPGSAGWGYDGVDLFAPHQAYGGADGLKRLVDAGHARGLAVILDVVYNHLGPAGNYLARFGPYFTGRYATPWGQAVNLDGPGSDEVRAFFVDNALSWLGDYHIDGLRLDAIHGLVDTSATHFLEQLTGRVKELADHLGRTLFLVAESDLNDPRVVTPVERGGYGIDAQWSDDFHHSLHAVLTGERSGYYADFGRLGDVATALRRAFVFAGGYSSFRERSHGRHDPLAGGGRFLGYLQNHDQIGNRATGERSGALMSLGRLMVGAALVLTAPFVPMLFAGEEWAASTPFPYFTDHQDPDLAEAVRQGRRREFAAFGWDPEDIPDPQDPATFASAKLDWGEAARPPHQEMLVWHRDLIALRRRLPALHDGRLDRVAVRHDETERWLVMERGPVRVVVNLGWDPVSLQVDGEPLLVSDPGAEAGGGRVLLPPDTVAILSV